MSNRSLLRMNMSNFTGVPRKNNVNPVTANAKSEEQIAEIKKELYDLKLAIADIVDSLPKPQTAINIATSMVADTAVAVCTAGASVAVPGLGQAIKSTATSIAERCVRKMQTLTPSERAIETFKKAVQDALDRSGGREGGLTPAAYERVLEFRDIKSPTITDLEKLRAHLISCREDSGSIKSSISFAAGLLIKKLKEASRVGGKKTFRKGRGAKRTAKSRKRL